MTFEHAMIVGQFLVIMALAAALITQAVLHGRAIRQDHEHVNRSWERAAIEAERARQQQDESIAAIARVKTGKPVVAPAPSGSPVTHPGVRSGIPRTQLATNGMG